MAAAVVLRWIFLFLSCLPHASSDKFSVVGAKAPISALLGSSVSLPCTLSTPIDVRLYEVRWYRPTMYDKPVLWYKNKTIMERSADQQYQGRVSLLGDLEKGDVSLKLDSLRLEDTGGYICHVTSEMWYDNSKILLEIQALGSTPILSVADAGGGQVNVTCLSHGWLPKPSLNWTDREGRDLKHLSKDTFTKDSTGLVNVSSWLIYSPSKSGWLSCSVALSDSKKERRESRLLPYTFTTESWKGSFIVTLILLLLCIMGVGVYCVLQQKGLIGSKRKKTEAIVPIEDKEESDALLKCHVEEDQQNQQKPQAAVPPNLTLSTEWNQARTYHVNITIDQADAPQFLRVGQDRKRIFCPHPKEDHEEEKNRIFALCKEKFSSGKHYWEVRVWSKPKEKLSWFVGVASESAERVYKSRLSPDNEFWVLCYEAERGVHIKGKVPTPLSDVSDELRTVGVFLDCEEHTLSFYDVDIQSLIYTFTSVQPRTSLLPLISPGIRDKTPVHIG